MNDPSTSTMRRTPRAAPEALLGLLRPPPEEGFPAADLVAARHQPMMVHYRIRALADGGRATQIKRRVWRAARPESDAA
jgi:hypothetical protein